MTHDQYLGTVAWLYILMVLWVVFNRIRSPLHVQKQKKHHWLIFITPFFLPTIFVERKIFNFGPLLAWIMTISIWSAYPLYLWVSTSFTFSINFIGG